MQHIKHTTDTEAASSVNKYSTLQFDWNSKPNVSWINCENYLKSACVAGKLWKILSVFVEHPLPTIPHRPHPIFHIPDLVWSWKWQRRNPLIREWRWLHKMCENIKQNFNKKWKKKKKKMILPLHFFIPLDFLVKV